MHSWSHCYVTDLTGSQDGSVQMWEWGHNQSVSTPRPSGTFAKVTRVRFSEHGNKFGVADGDGNLSLWQVGLASASSRPFFVSCTLCAWYLIISAMTDHCFLYEIVSQWWRFWVVIFWVGDKLMLSVPWSWIHWTLKTVWLYMVESDLKYSRAALLKLCVTSSCYVLSWKIWLSAAWFTS
jgi:hypothetical protein